MSIHRKGWKECHMHSHSVQIIWIVQINYRDIVEYLLKVHSCVPKRTSGMFDILAVQI